MNVAAGQVHEVATDAVFGRLRSRPEGLTAAEASARLREVGLNRLRPPSKLRWFQTLAKHFINFFSILLDIAGVVCFIAEAIQPGDGMAVLGWALLGVSVLNALFAFAAWLGIPLIFVLDLMRKQVLRGSRSTS